MLICRTPHEESSTFLCVTFRLVCERFGLFARGSNVFCERFILHVWAFIVFTSIGLNCVLKIKMLFGVTVILYFLKILSGSRN